MKMSRCAARFSSYPGMAEVPQEPLTIARRFNAGNWFADSEVPQGRLNCGGMIKSLRDLVAVLFVLIFFTLVATADTTTNLSDSEIQGRALVQQILIRLDQPSTNSWTTAELKTHDDQGYRTIPVVIENVVATESTFLVLVYQIDWTNRIEQLSISRLLNQTNSYFYDTNISKTGFPYFKGETTFTNQAPFIVPPNPSIERK